MDIEIRHDHYIVFRNPVRSIIILIMITAHYRASTFLTVSLHYDSFWWRVNTCLFVVCSFVCLLVCYFVCDAFCLRNIFLLKTDTKPYFELLKAAPQDARFSRYCCFDHCQKSNDLNITQKHCLF